MRFDHSTGPEPHVIEPGSEQEPSGGQPSARSRRPTGRSMALGGLIGVILVAALAWLTGAGPFGPPGADSDGRAEQGDIGLLAAKCGPIADVNAGNDCRYVRLVDSIQRFWADEFADRGASYEPAATTLFSESVRTACGAAADQVGPFYCPADDTVYLDLDFLDALRAQHSAGSEAFGEAYVLAHAYGHHIQNLTGRMQGLRAGSGPTSDAIRLELQADCYAGVWAHHATGPSSAGEALFTDVTDEDVEDALAAAETVGDDYIEEHFRGTIAPELWAHGSGAQRLRWFEIGFAGGALEGCDTFSATIL